MKEARGVNHLKKSYPRDFQRLRGTRGGTCYKYVHSDKPLEEAREEDF